MQTETIFKFFLLIIILALLWALSEWLLRYKKGFYRPKESQFFKRLESLYLNPQNSLELIQIGETKIILLAVSPNHTDIVLNLEINELKPNQGEKA